MGFYDCFPDPPGYRETVKALEESRKLAEQEAQKEDESPKKKPKPTGPKVFREPDKPGKFGVGRRVDLYWGPKLGWRGPYEVKSGLRGKGATGVGLVKLYNPITKSAQFVSENRIRASQKDRFE